MFGTYVLPRHRRQGVARRLVVEALRWARERGLKRVSVGTGARNRPIHRLYRSLGFRPCWVTMEGALDSLAADSNADKEMEP